ncbi:MAG: hypothetical protein ACRCYA_06205, partial [Cetobacterium sp.]|uniref:hypothetical protein n=1 Tax=Cetobacterium sp. TaxID=2071632 RepID=UPI003F40DF9A
GLNSYKDISTRDIICLDFDYGSRSYEEELSRITETINKEKGKEVIDEEKLNCLNLILESTKQNKDKFNKKSKEEIREEFYQNGIPITYKKVVKSTGEVKEDVIKYKMLYRNPSKAKMGQVMFINEKLYKKAYDWLTMGIGKKMGTGNAKIVEMSAYAPLTTSTIVDTIHIPIEDVLILRDQDSFFKTIANVVKAEEYEVEEKVVDEEKTEENRLMSIKNGDKSYKKKWKTIKTKHKKCIVETEETNVKNTLWDGMALIENDILSNDINGMVLFRNHFFKACAFRTNIKKFFKDWSEKNGFDYNTYEVEDMFGVRHKLKDIKMITTDNAIKWFKFKELMGETPTDQYEYWCNKINEDGSIFGVVKTDHKSKLGDVQQMSYQMINTLPCAKEDIENLSFESVKYVELLKADNKEFEKFLRGNYNEINHYEMLADLYSHNNEFANSKWFRYEKRQIIRSYVDRLRGGKITLNADNLTACGNPYALLLHSVGEDWRKDPTLGFESGTIQCYTTRFKDGEYLCAIRNPHNSPNNICYLHNKHSKEMEEYFPFSENIIAINCIESDIQDRANGADFDSDFFYVTNNEVMIKCAKKAYKEFPTVVNKLKESGLTYKNNMIEYARMDNKFSKARMGIGESSNLAQLAMTYYWNNIDSKELYDNFIILAVLAQVVIDGCKREYEVDALQEIARIKKMDCMINMVKSKSGDFIKKDLPIFMKYTKDVPTTSKGKFREYSEIKADKEKIENRIDENLECPMNWLQDCLSSIKQSTTKETIDTKEFFIKMQGKPKNEQMTKIRKLIMEYDNFVKCHRFDEDGIDELIMRNELLMDSLNKIKIGNIITINRLIETALGLESKSKITTVNSSNVRYTRKILNCLYRMNKEKFLMNFQ